MAGWGGDWGTAFFNPNSQYGGTWAPGEFAQTPSASVYFAQNGEAAWTRLLGEMGLDPQSGKGQYGRSLWPQVMEGFKAANATNINLKLEDYIKTLDVNGMYQNQSNAQRGENPAKVAPLARTISRGYGG